MVEERLQLERELCRIGKAREFALVDRVLDGGREVAVPAAQRRDERVAHGAGSGIELDGGLEKEASAREDPRAGVFQPESGERRHPGHPARMCSRRLDDPLAEDGLRRIDDGELQAFLASEQRCDAALADVAVRGEPAERDAVESVDRGLLHREGEQGATALVAAGAASVDDLHAANLHVRPFVLLFELTERPYVYLVELPTCPDPSACSTPSHRPAAARAAYPLLVTPGPRLKVRPADAPTMDEARESTLQVRGRRVVSYEWGSGSSVVLLVHGWRGRASQFASLVRELRYEGHTVVAFDAPACGASEGTRTDAADYLEAMRAMQSRYGAFSGVVGHSFGSLVGLAAIREGFTAARFVGIASIPDAGYLMTSFADRVGLGTAANDRLVRRFQRLRFSDGPDMLERFSGVRNPVEVPTLFVHDADDREVSVTASESLHAAHGSSSTLVVTRGQGHVRVLGADEVLDQVVGFLAAEPARVGGAAL